MLFGCGAVMLSAAMNRGTNAATVCVLRGLVFSSLLLVLIKKRRLSLSLTRKQFFQMVPILCMAGMTSATLNVAYCFLPTGVASSIHFVYPVIVVAAETLLFRTYIKKAAFPFLALSMVGIYLQTNQTQTVALSGVLIALLSAVFWTSYIVLFEHSELRTVHPFVLNFYQGIILMAIGGIWLAVSDSPFLVADAECLLLIIGDGIIAGIVAHLFLQAGVAALGGTLAAVMSVMEPVTSFGLGALLLQQQMSENQWVACLLILGSSLGLMLTDFFAGKTTKQLKTKEEKEQKMSCIFTLRHVGVNTENAEEALALAELLSGMFNLAPRHGQKSEFAGPYFECMKAPFHGKNGHIAMQTPDLESAVAELREKGFSFCDETAAYDDAGKLKNIYLAGEYGGFAIHILRG